MVLLEDQNGGMAEVHFEVLNEEVEREVRFRVRRAEIPRRQGCVRNGGNDVEAPCWLRILDDFAKLRLIACA